MARSKKPASEAGTSMAKSDGPAQSAPPPSRASVRMYRQGLGDCFLIMLAKQDGSAWRMLIDCGVILGTKDVNERMREVIANLEDDTGGRVDVLVISHEHYDHVAAFAALNASFCSDSERRAEGQLQVGEVWFAWTEDPDDALGQKLSKARAAQVNRLAAMIGQLQSGNRPMSPATATMANGLAG